jgi:ABC-type branched-chain amino acid transport systems, ATPase component
MTDAPLADQPPILTLDTIRKSFGRVTVAAGLSLSVARHEALGIVGPNGAGKSSLFSLISGDLSPDSGAILLHGRDVTALQPEARCRLGIGRTYQVPRSFEHMTVFENTLVAAHQGASARRQQAYDLAVEVLVTCELLDLANRRAGQLTLLQRKRLEVARALATGPDLLLLDEVAGGLTDPEVEELVAIIKRVHQAGVTIIWIEHVVRALTRTVDRLICLAGGGIIADGDPHDVMDSDAVRELYLGVGPELDPPRVQAADPEEKPR